MYTIEFNGKTFKGDYREAMEFLVNTEYDTSVEALNIRFGNTKNAKAKKIGEETVRKLSKRKAARSL